MPGLLRSVTPPRGRPSLLSAPLLAALLLATASWPALAHHSFAMYDYKKSLTLTGTVKSFEWTNPHIILWLEAEQAGAAPQLWTLEISSPGAMTRAGWTRHSLQPGEKVVVQVAPLRDGNHGGSLLKVTTPDGSVLTNQLGTICKPDLQ